jgi:hypothetical protein
MPLRPCGEGLSRWKSAAATESRVGDQRGLDLGEAATMNAGCHVCYLVSCVGQKARAPTRAADLYTSAWFQKARNYVEAVGAPWFILSAEHGLVGPETVIAPYEKTLNHMGVEARREWAGRVIGQMESQLPQCEEIIVFAGARYREFLMDYLRRRAARITVPLEGLRIGEQLSWFGTQRPSSTRS